MTLRAPFNRSAMALLPLRQRGHDLGREACLPTCLPHRSQVPEVASLARANLATSGTSSPIVLFLGGHPIKLGLSRYLIDLIERGFITHLASNGSALIHDFELALVGGTFEDPRLPIRGVPESQASVAT
jgi:hypothetical protein